MPNIEKRKLIKLGNSYAVTLPRSWLNWVETLLKDKSLDDLVLEIESDKEVVIRLPEEIVKKLEAIA